MKVPTPKKVSSLCLPCGTESFRTIRQSFTNFLEETPFLENEKALLILAVDEACANVLRHAYGNNPQRPLRLHFELLKIGLRVTIRDYGKSCCPSKIRGRKLTDYRPGGLGVHLIQQAFDKVDYLPQKKGTRLTLLKVFPPEQRQL